MAFSTLFNQLGRQARVQVYTIPWTADGAGSYTETITGVNGVLLRVATDPGNGPTDNYDVTLTDVAGVDVLAGRGADRDTAVSEHFCPLAPASDGVTATAVPVAVAGDLVLSITNAGAAKTGTVYLFVG